MIVEEIINERLVKHCSDANKYIIQNETGNEYTEAIDVRPCRYTYTESDKDIEEQESEETGL